MWRSFAVIDKLFASFCMITQKINAYAINLLVHSVQCKNKYVRCFYKSNIILLKFLKSGSRKLSLHVLMEILKYFYKQPWTKSLSINLNLTLPYINKCVDVGFLYLQDYNATWDNRVWYMIGKNGYRQVYQIQPQFNPHGRMEIPNLHT
jgi:hypothetical protein